MMFVRFVMMLVCFRVFGVFPDVSHVYCICVGRVYFRLRAEASTHVHLGPSGTRHPRVHLRPYTRRRYVLFCAFLFLCVFSLPAIIAPAAIFYYY